MKSRWPQMVLAPAGLYFQPCGRGVVHILRQCVRVDGRWLVAVCGRRFRRAPAETVRYASMPSPKGYRACRACCRKLRRHIDEFEEGSR